MNVVCRIASTLFLIPTLVHAAEPNSLIGNWVETFPNGHQMVTQFTADSIVTMTRDASGSLSKPIASGHVTYRNLGTSTLGKGYAVDFLGQDGKPDGGIMAFLRDPNNMTLDFPGAGAHHLERLPR